MARRTQASSHSALNRISLEGEMASAADVAKLRELCQRVGRPMLSEPLTRLRVIAYTNALNRRSR